MALFPAKICINSICTREAENSSQAKHIRKHQQYSIQEKLVKPTCAGTGKAETNSNEDVID